MTDSVTSSSAPSAAKVVEGAVSAEVTAVEGKVKAFAKKALPYVIGLVVGAVAAKIL